MKPIALYNESSCMCSCNYFRFYCFFYYILFPKDGAPKTVAGFRVQLLQMKEDGLHIRTAGSLFVRTQRLLLSEMQLFSHLTDIRLMHQTKGTDDGERIMF